MELKELAIIREDMYGAVHICEDEQGVRYTVWEMKRKEAEAFFYSNCIQNGERMRLLFPYEEPRPLFRFYKGKICTWQERKRLYENVVKACSRQQLPYPILYLLLTEKCLNLRKDGSVSLHYNVSLEGLDAGKDKKSCVQACAGLLLELMGQGDKEEKVCYALMQKKKRRNTYQDFEGLLEDLRLLDGRRRLRPFVRLPKPKQSTGESEKATGYLRARDKKDYYRLGRWFISKRFAYVLTLLLFIFSILCLLLFRPEKSSGSKKGYPVFRENSIPLMLYRGKAELQDSKGRIRYAGSVKRGRAEGKGEAYDSKGRILYRGNFREGAYDGKGILYNRKGTAVYKGEFKEGEIVYEKLVGVDTKAVAEMYKGRQSIYQGNHSFCSFLADIEAVYYGADSKKEILKEWNTEGVYVLRSEIRIGKDAKASAEELADCFGPPVYEGYTILKFEDVAAMSFLSEEQMSIYPDRPCLETEGAYEDAKNVVDYERNLRLYVRSYEKDGYMYTFFFSSRQGAFGFYLIEERRLE